MGALVEVQDEALLDAVTAVAGSGPAYFFALTEYLIHAAIDLGISPDDARKLVLQTAFGAAEVLRRDQRTPEEWRAAVTSPHGTTAAAFEVLDGNGWGRIFREGVARACERARELAKQR
jgi:pyrroline-5-carboxylate reductase